jgi:hypothetical protein
MIRLLKTGMAAATAVSASMSTHYFAAPAIKRVETVNFANLMSTVGTPYVAPGKTKEYYIYGPWLDYTSEVRFLNATQTIVEKKATWDDDGALLRVKLTGSGERGIKTATIRISCPTVPLTGIIIGDCRNVTLNLNVMVLSSGTVTRIDPDTVEPQSRNPFHVYGTNLANATVFEFRTDLKAIDDVSGTTSQLNFTGTSSTCGTNRVMIRDKAEGGDFYPFGGVDVRLTKPCGYTGVSSGMILGGSSPGGPDLQPVSGAPLLRHIAPNRKLSSETFCNGMFAQAVQAIVKTITVQNMTWGVKNTGGSNVTTAFHVQLFRNGTLVRDQIVNSLNAGATATFTYARPESQTEVARLGLVPPLTTQQLYNATGGECVQTVGQAAQYDWQDPQYEIRVDPAGAIATDINKGNNNKSF